MPGKTNSDPMNMETSRFAPWFSVPDHLIVNVEHPCIIKNIDRGIESLGGEVKIQKLVQDGNPTPVANLYLHPGDRSIKPTSAHNVKTNNIVLKVTVPKRTGRKRKRGSSGLYHEDSDETQEQPSLTSRDTRGLLRSLRDNIGKYEIQPVGYIHETHRFRNMVDFVTSTTGPNNVFMQKVRENILPFEYEKLKKFKFDMSKGVKPNTEVIAPPSWSHLSIPFNYMYKQNPLVQQILDPQGRVTMVNVSANTKFSNHPVPYNIPNVPIGPTPDHPPLESLEPELRNLVEEARELFEKRPVWTRRALRNNLSPEAWNKVGPNSAKYIYQYVGYMFSSGPWRDAIIKFGFDPRCEPEFRKYQTLMFMLENEPSDNRLDKLRDRRTKIDSAKLAEAQIKDSHMFDGRNVSLDGKVWQICDITDPLLKDVLSTTAVRTTCHIKGDGWFHNGTIAKAKIVMKFKIHSILNGQIPNDADYLNVVKLFPDDYNEHTRESAHLARGKGTPLEFRLLGEIRTTAARHSYGKKANPEDLQRRLHGPTEANGGSTPDAASMDPSLPKAPEIDPRVTMSLEEFDKVERAAMFHSRSQHPANGDADSSSSEPDGGEDMESGVDGEDVRSKGSTSAEDDDDEEEQEDKGEEDDYDDEHEALDDVDPDREELETIAEESPTGDVAMDQPAGGDELED